MLVFNAMAISFDTNKPQTLASYIDHTLLAPQASKYQVRVLCEEALVAERLQIKASGGIRDIKIAATLIAAGATRLGTSSGGMLVKGQDASNRNY